MFVKNIFSQATTAATALFAGTISRHRSNVLDTTDLQARTGQCTQGRLSSWSGTFRLVATGCAHLDMQSGETKFLQQKTAAQLTWLYQVRWPSGNPAN